MATNYFTYEQINDPAFFAEHEAEIALAMAEGRIVETLPEPGPVMDDKGQPATMDQSGTKPTTVTDDVAQGSEWDAPAAQELRKRFLLLGYMLTYETLNGWAYGDGLFYNWPDIVKKCDELERNLNAQGAAVTITPPIEHVEDTTKPEGAKLPDGIIAKTIYFFVCKKCGKDYRRTMEFKRAVEGICNNCLKPAKAQVPGQLTIDGPME